MQEMPSENRLIQVVKVLYCFNIMFSYPLTIYPTNVVLDSILFRRPRYHAENFIRLCVLILGMQLAIHFYDKLDKILALSGTLLGTSVVLFLPALCHYKLMQSSNKVDLFIVSYSLLVLVGCTSIIIYQWS